MSLENSVIPSYSGSVQFGRLKSQAIRKTKKRTNTPGQVEHVSISRRHSRSIYDACSNDRDTPNNNARAGGTNRETRFQFFPRSGRRKDVGDRYKIRFSP